MQVKVLRNSTRATSLSKNIVTVIPHPQSTNFTVNGFIGTTFYQRNSSNKNCLYLRSPLIPQEINILLVIMADHLYLKAVLVVFVCHCLVVVRIASLTLMPTLYVGCQCGRMRIFQSSADDRVNIQSSHWCPLLSPFSQDDSHPLQHSWDKLHCPFLPLPASVLL